MARFKNKKEKQDFIEKHQKKLKEAEKELLLFKNKDESIYKEWAIDTRERELFVAGCLVGFVELEKQFLMSVMFK